MIKIICIGTADICAANKLLITWPDAVLQDKKSR